MIFIGCPMKWLVHFAPGAPRDVLHGVPPKALLAGLLGDPLLRSSAAGVHGLVDTWDIETRWGHQLKHLEMWELRCFFWVFSDTEMVQTVTVKNVNFLTEMVFSHCLMFILRDVVAVVQTKCVRSMAHFHVLQSCNILLDIPNVLGACWFPPLTLLIVC